MQKIRNPNIIDLFRYWNKRIGERIGWIEIEITLITLECNLPFNITQFDSKPLPG